MLKRLFIILICFSLLQGLVNVGAAGDTAADLSKDCTVTTDGNKAYLTDNNIYTYTKLTGIEVISDTPIYGVYVLFDRSPTEWKLVADGREQSCGKNGFLHELVELDGATELTLSFNEGTYIADIFFYGEGALPDTVQRWELLDKADIMICPTHSDDDQLYFAGMIPWACAKGYDVQIVYFTNHWNTHDRPHELLNGLWHCGLKYYPYIAEHPDLYSQSLAEAEQAFGSVGLSKEHFIEFYVELFQRYRPLVVAGHDLGGEYGHGAHMLNSLVLREAVEKSAERGLWDVKKTYIHMWKENSVSFNWDIPMEELGGKTPFEVSQEGYGYHYSQHRFEGLSRWLYGTELAPITKASQIYSYSPCSYGLYRSTVGADTVENSLFENIKSYKEQAAEQKPPAVEPPPPPAPPTPPAEEKPSYPPCLWTKLKATEYAKTWQPIAGKPITEPANEKEADATPYIIAAVLSTLILGVAIIITRKKENDSKHKNQA